MKGAGLLSKSGLHVTGLSVLSAILALSVLPLVESWERASVDLRMRWRYTLRGPSQSRGMGHIVVVAIDTKSVRKLGRFGAGEWICRKPFVDQLVFFQQYFRPAALAYDIIFQEDLGPGPVARWTGQTEIMGLSDVKCRIDGAAAEGEEIVSPAILRDINRFTAQQGTLFLAHRFAAVIEKKLFYPIIGYSFRHTMGEGGSLSVGKGSDPGMGVEYLKDMRIPAADVVFGGDAESRRQLLRESVNLPSRILWDYSLMGFLDCPRDSDGMIRRIPMILGFNHIDPETGKQETIVVPSFDLVACLLDMGISFPLQAGAVSVRMGECITIHPPAGRPCRIPVDARGCMYLNYRNRFDDFDAISFVDAASPLEQVNISRRESMARKYKKTVDGRIAVVALNTVGIDRGPTPLVSETPLVLVHLTAMQNILDRDFIAPLGGLHQRWLLAALAVLFTGICFVERTWRFGGVAAASVVVYLAVSYLGVHFGIVVLPVIAPLIYLATVSFGVLSYRFLTEERERRKVRNMFSTMVSDRVLAYLEENPESFSLRGHNVETTVFFSDIANFTSISERLSPDSLTDLLNSYLTPATEIIMETGGYVDKYLGDGIMAVWGAPFADTEHAIRACSAALQQQHVVREAEAEWRNRCGEALRVRMGINSGIVTAGNVGSRKNFQYTVMGDAANVASRLQVLNIDFGTDIIIGENTRRFLRDAFVVRRLGKVAVTGKREVVEVFELTGRKGDVEDEIMAALRRYEEALDLFYRRQWEACIVMVDELIAKFDDGPSKRLRGAALFMQRTPPPESWGGELSQRVGK